MSDTTPVLLFSLCQRRYAVAIADVVEVAAMVETVPFGDAESPALHGVVVRRGEPMMLVDLRHVFACEEAPVTLETLFIVIQHGNKLVGFIVDHIEGVVYFSTQAVRPVQSGNRFVQSLVSYDNEIVQWLDVSSVVAQTLPAEM